MNPQVTVSENAVAKIVAHAAVTTLGVVRLAPSLGMRVKGVATRAARQLAAKAVIDSSPTDSGPSDAGLADPDAIAIDNDGTQPMITVRIVAATTPPVLATIEAVASSVGAALAELPYPAVLTILVVDTEPG